MAGELRRLHEKRRGGAKRSRPALAGAAAALVGLLDPGLGRADEPTRPIVQAIELGPSRCLEAVALAGHVSMWLGTSDIDRRLSITVHDAAEGVRFVVRRDDQPLGERTLEVRKVPCEEIHAAVGLGVAAAIDATVLASLGVTPAPAGPGPAPDVASTFPAPAPFPAPEPSPFTLPWAMPPPPPPGLVPWTATAPPPPPKGPVLTVTVQGMVLLQVLPEVALGVAPAAELSVVRGFDLRLSGLATGTTTIDLGGGTADAALLAGRLDACAALVLGDDLARLRACGGLLVGAVNAQGRGFPDARTATAPWVAPAVRVDGRWSLTRTFGLVVGIDGFFPGLKPELQVVDAEGVVTAARTFPLAGLGVSVGPSLTF